jgi:hypothetical protein
MHPDILPKAYEIELPAYDSKELMPSNEELNALGIETKEGVTYGLAKYNKYSHPVFLRAFKSFYNEYPDLSYIEDKLLSSYYENIVRKDSSKSNDYNYTHNIVWSDVLNQKTRIHQKIESNILLSKIGNNNNSELGLVTGASHFITNSEMQDLSKYRYRSILDKFYNHEKEYGRGNLFPLCLMGYFDFGSDFDIVDNYTVGKLLTFYNKAVNNNTGVAAMAWISDDWKATKYAILDYATTMEQDDFDKLVTAEIPIKHWDSHAGLPLEWLLNMYNNS